MRKGTSVWTIEYWALVILFRLMLDWAYGSVISVLYAYAGFQNNQTVLSAILSWVLLVLFALLAKKAANNRDNRASHEIVFILFLISIVPFTSMICFCALAWPMIWLAAVYWVILLLLLVHYSPPIFKKKRRLQMEYAGFLNEKLLKCIAIVSVLVVFYISGRYTHFRFNFRLDNVYEFRAEAKAFQMPIWLKYAFSFSKYVNAILIAYFLRKKNLLWAAICVIAQLLNFGIDGSKSTLFLMLFSILINFLPQYSFQTMNRWILRGFSALACGCVLLFKLFGALMPISLFLRRMMLVPLQISGYYVDFFTQHVPDYFRQGFLRHFGFQSPYTDTSIAYMIGDIYEHKVTSANNGLVGDAIANLGIPGILVFPILLLIVLRVLDRCSAGLDRRIFVTVALYAAVTLTNSFLFTTLLSHGLLVTMLLLALMKREPVGRLHAIPMKEEASSDSEETGLSPLSDISGGMI